MGTYTKLLQTDKEKPELEKSVQSPTPKKKTPRKRKAKKPEPTVSRHHDTTTPRYHDTMTPWYHDTTIEEIRKAVKQFGKEAATHRFTEAEKKAIAGIVFTYKNQGIITSENEIARIAINIVIKDFEQNGEKSILAKALKALND